MYWLHHLITYYKNDTIIPHYPYFYFWITPAFSESIPPLFMPFFIDNTKLHLRLVASVYHSDEKFIMYFQVSMDE